MADKLFVYGTLKNGKGKRAHVRGTLYNLGYYPGYTQTGNDLVEGEIHDITTDELKKLDLYEGVPQGLYRREVIKTEDGDNVWVYIYAMSIHPTVPKIADGRWTNHDW